MCPFFLTTEMETNPSKFPKNFLFEPAIHEQVFFDLMKLSPNLKPIAIVFRQCQSSDFSISLTEIKPN